MNGDLMPTLLKPGAMSEVDHEASIYMRESGILVPIEDEQLPKGGWMFGGCEDGDRTPEAAAHLRRKLNSLNGEVTCTQLLYITGGPAVASPHCPFYNLTYKGAVVAKGDELLFARIEKGLIAKPGKIRNFGHKPHCACGMCSVYKVDLWDNLRHSFECKDLVRTEFPNNFDYHAVLPHLDFTGYRDEERPFRTYYCNRRKFEMHYDKHTSQTRSAA
jgi:hypothetical protein